jgi:hypothetical protein
VFTPDEIAEACASAVGLTIPTEPQVKMKADGRPLLERFRQLAPPRERISIQRWSAQRLLLTSRARRSASCCWWCCSSTRCAPAWPDTPAVDRYLAGQGGGPASRRGGQLWGWWK